MKIRIIIPVAWKLLLFVELLFKSLGLEPGEAGKGYHRNNNNNNNNMISFNQP